MTDSASHSDTFAFQPDGGGLVELTSVELGKYLATLGLRYDQHAVHMLAGELGLETSPFEIRIGEWQLNTSVAAARALVNGVVLTAALAAKGETSIPATVLSVVVPLVFDLERVTVSASDRIVFTDLLRHAPTRQHIDEWYDDLGDHIRAEITKLEFCDLVERLEDAGLVDRDPFDIVAVDPPTQRRRRRLELPPPD